MTDGKSDRYGVSDSELGDNGDDDSDPTGESELPHRVRHESPKTNRSEMQFLLSDEDDRALMNRKSLAEQVFDETVYATDVKLAALRAGLNATDDEFLDEMEAIGYGYFD